MSNRTALLLILLIFVFAVSVLGGAVALHVVGSVKLAEFVGVMSVLSIILAFILTLVALLRSENFL